MKKRKTLLAVSLLLLLSIIGIYLDSNPILFKYIFSSSRNLGKPIAVKIYADGKLNDSMELYKVNSYFDGTKANYDILVFKDPVSRNVISINYDYNYIGLASSTNEKDYKVIFGNLFQSDVGAKFTPINDGIKGFGFDPELKFNSEVIEFKLPKKQFGYDSISIKR